MKNTFALIILAASLCVAGAQTSNLLSLVNLGSGPNTGTGDPLRTALGKINTNLLVLAGAVDKSITNVVFTNTTTLAAGSSATATNVGTIGGIAYFSLGIPQGVQGVAGNDSTNAIWPTPEFTLTNINPLYCTGSNYIGSFSQLYRFNLQLPSTSVGQSVGSNLNESVIISTNGGTAWFTNSDVAGTVAWWTNVMVAVVGDNNTNFAGAITLYGLNNFTHYNNTNDLTSQHLLVSDGSQTKEAVNYGQMTAAIANATAMSWQLSGSHYVFAPNGQTNVDLTIGGTLGAWFTKVLSSGTNWVLTATNVSLGYQLQIQTNLALIYGWSSLTPTTDYSVVTNLYNATNAWTFTVPKYKVPADYGFFRVVAFQTAKTTIWPPLKLNSVMGFSSNAWSDTYAQITNTFTSGSAGQGSSNGVPVNWIYTNGVVYAWPW